MIEAVHQVVPSLAGADAVGAHTLRVRDTLVAAGIRSEIFAGDLEPGMASEARLARYLPEPDPERMALIYQCSIGNEVVDRLLRRPDPLVVNYHNLTPAEQLFRWAPDMAHLVSWGRHQLAALAPRAVLGIGDSPYNTEELARLGYRSTATVPALVDLGTDTSPRQRQPGGSRWLFVGRIVPNKAQHDLVLALAWHRRVHDPGAVLQLVGRCAAPSYQRALEELVAELGLQDAVTITGSISDAALLRAYQDADVFVCLSDHEGFGIPLLEAMAHGVPVVALARAAVPHTVGDAGLLLPHKAPDLVAAAAHRAASDPDLRTALCARGHRRARQFDVSNTGPRFLDALGAALPLGPPASRSGSIERP